MAKQTTTMYLVTDRNKNEGVAFSNLLDAQQAAGKKKLGGFYAALAGEWRELHDEQKTFTITEIEV